MCSPPVIDLLLSCNIPKNIAYHTGHRLSPLPPPRATSQSKSSGWAPISLEHRKTDGISMEFPPIFFGNLRQTRKIPSKSPGKYFTQQMRWVT